MVRDANVELAPDPIGATQYVEYRQRSSENAIALISALLAIPLLCRCLIRFLSRRRHRSLISRRSGKHSLPTRCRLPSSSHCSTS